MNNLYLSKYPHITVPEATGDMESRSQSIIRIKSIMDNLHDAMKTYFDDLVNFDEKVKLLDQREENIKSDELTLKEKEQEVYVLEDKLKSEKEYIALANKTLREKEEKMSSDKELLVQIEQEKVLYEDRKSEAIRQEKITDDKIKEYNNLKVIAKELEEREMLVTRSEEIDVERKRMLDLREERIHKTMIRLHMENEE
jgi:hypothetical protein